MQKVLQIAEAEVGYLEKNSTANLDVKEAGAGDGNYTKYWRDLQPSFQGQPWCQGFVNWIFTQAYGVDTAKKLLCTSSSWSYYTPTCAGYFKSKKQWYTSKPKVGDIIYFKNSSRICHVGIVYKVDSSKVYTIEGNTSSASGVIANGGGVAKKSYALNYNRIAGYGRPDYEGILGTSTSETTSTDSEFTSKMVKVTAWALNVRKGPAKTYAITTVIKDQGVYTIVEEQNGWGLLKSYAKNRDGWISLAYTKEV